MGLDIYLYNGDLNLHFGDTPDQEKDEHGWRKRGEWWKRPNRAEAKSQKYPEHYCERTYLRSSYNSGGFNSVVRDLIGPRDFAYIFGEKISGGLAEPPREDDEDEGGVATKLLTTKQVKAELRAALPRAREVAEALRTTEPVHVTTISADSVFGGNANVESWQAVELYRKELKRERSPDFTAYSNRDGHFYLGEPLKVVAAIPGMEYRRPCVHLVVQVDMTWYIQAAEIAEEFIEYALTLEDPRISWSG